MLKNGFVLENIAITTDLYLSIKYQYMEGLNNKI